MKIEYKETNIAGDYRVFANVTEIGYLSGDCPESQRMHFEWDPDFNLGKLDSGETVFRVDSTVELEERIETTIKNLIAELRGLIE